MHGKKILKGLQEAIAYARGDQSMAKEHVVLAPAQIIARIQCNADPLSDQRAIDSAAQGDTPNR